MPLYVPLDKVFPLSTCKHGVPSAHGRPCHALPVQSLGKTSSSVPSACRLAWSSWGLHRVHSEGWPLSLSSVSQRVAACTVPVTLVFSRTPLLSVANGVATL